MRSSFLFSATKELRARCGIHEPLVVLTDQCKEMKAALADVFPDSQQQLCIFHIMKNILLNAKRKYQHGAEPDSDDEEEEENVNEPVVLDRSDLVLLEREKNHNSATGEEPAVAPQLPSKDYHGVVAMFRVMLYAKTEADFLAA